MTNGIRFQSFGTLSVVAILILIVLFILLIPLMFLSLVGAAFARLGFSWLSAIAAILLILLGSTVNIPLYTIKRDMIRIEPPGASMSDPFTSWSDGLVWETVVSISLGGAFLPLCMAMYLLYTALPLTGSTLVLPICTGILVVAVITYMATRPISGIGLQVPILIPALTALLVAVLLAGGVGITAAVSAFVSGTVGVLVGGNLAQIPKIKDLGLPVWNIGGSGTFGSILICCILPALVV
ncbi:MAG: DUF1614 domain-containing protein [Methanoregula sp.]|jgi:uncharacterized membrane protein|nr:DUF1614 domain-containing protein [Methanoregula sp.]